MRNALVARMDGCLEWLRSMCFRHRYVVGIIFTASINLFSEVLFDNDIHVAITEQK
jgi:hypothetical protein